MRSLPPPISPPSWRHQWRRWTEVVVGFALRRPARWRVRPREYEALQAALVSACREPAGADPDRREYYEGLAALVSPWLTTRVLEQTDRSLLLDLADRCQRVDRELNGDDWGRVIRTWGGRLLAGVGVICFLAVGIPLAGDWIGGWLEDVRRSVRLAVGELTLMQQYLAAGIGISLLAMGLLRYTRQG